MSAIGTKPSESFKSGRPNIVMIMVTLFLLKTGDRNHKKTVMGRSMMKLNPHNFKIRICEKESFQQRLFFIIYRKPVLSGHDHHDFIIIYCNAPNITSFYCD